MKMIPSNKPSLILLFVTVLLLYSCNIKRGQSSHVLKKINATAFPHPQAPKVTLNAVPLSIPAGKPIIVKASAPVIKHAGFFAPMQNYNTEQGLPISAVHSIFTDNAGNLWIGTEGGGVSRYDGNSFTTYIAMQGLENDAIYSIGEDKYHNMWFGTYGGGVSCYNGRSFKNYTKKDGLGENTVDCIAADSTGKVWFGTSGGGLSCFDGKKFTTYAQKQGLAGSSISGLLPGKKRGLWLASPNGGLYNYDENKFTRYTVKDGLPSDHITCVAQDKWGNIWAGSADSGVCRFNGKSFTIYTNKNGLASNKISCIYADNIGNVWFGTEGKGVSRYDGKSFTTFTTENGLAGNIVFSIAQDKSGYTWIGTEDGGLSRYDGNSLTLYSNNEGMLNSMVYSIFQCKDSTLWLGTNGGGVCHYDGNNFTSYTTREGMPTNIILSILQDTKGNMWFGTQGKGVCCFDGKIFKIYTPAQGISSSNVFGIYEANDSTYWFATDGGGACRFDGKSFSAYTTMQGLGGDIVFGIIPGKNNNLWFATNDGLSCFNGKSITTYKKEQGLSNNCIFGGTCDSCGNLWLATNGGGVCRFDGKSFYAYTTQQGVSDNVVLDALFDKKGRLWLGTNKGLTLIKGFAATQKNKAVQEVNNSLSNEDLSENYSPIVEQYNEKDGYAIKDMINNALICDKNNILWGGSGTKLIRFDYNSVIKSNAQPGVVIKAVKIDNRNIYWYDLQQANISPASIVSANVANEIEISGNPLSPSQRDSLRRKLKGVRFDSLSRFYTIPENLVLPYNHNNITFDFAAIEPAKPYLVSYQYFLQGYDKGWSPVTDKTSATFGNIHEGTYSFMLKARSAGGKWSRPVIYSFTVLPPLYCTWWAYGSYMLTLVLILYGIFRWRTEALRKDKLKLEQTVKERTVEVVKQKTLVEEKNKEILDSINYAKRLQDAILPAMNMVKKSIPDSFILYKPKDIVAGDFYWFAPLPSSGYLIAACDCTGHGVPGAMVSMVCSGALNRAVKEFGLAEPGKILDKVRELVLETFEKSEDDVQDGMDISLASLSPAGGGTKLQWAGAYNPLWVITSPKGDGKDEVIELAPDKQPIGKTDNPKPFNTRTLTFPQSGGGGAVLYLFTDGYADQFGGPKGKKFKYKQLSDLLSAISEKPMDEQKRLLEQTLENWKGSLEQVDDILIIGIRL